MSSEKEFKTGFSTSLKISTFQKLDEYAKDLRMPRADIGDRITFTHAGSYACTLSPHQFGSQKKPDEVLRPQGTISH